MNLIMFRLNVQTRLEAISAVLVKIKMKAGTKLTVVICCQILARKSVRHLATIFGGDRCRGRPVGKIRNFEEKNLVKELIHPLRSLGRTSARGGFPSTIESPSTIYGFNIFFFKYGEIWGRLEKVASRHKLLLRILSKIRNGFWVNSESNRFGVGQSISPIVEICL